MNRGLLRWRQRRGALGATGKEVAAVVIAALVALGGVYAYSYERPSAPTYGVTILVQIFGTLVNSTGTIPASYDADNFTVFKGETVTMDIQNTDNMTHGLAIPAFHIDTGPMKPNATATVTFTPTVPGNYTYFEPKADCGGDNCDANTALTGWMLVVPGA